MVHQSVYIEGPLFSLHILGLEVGFLTDFCHSLQNEQQLKTNLNLDRGRAMPTQCTKRLIIKSTIF